MLPEWAWTPAVDAAGGLRDGAEVAEVTGISSIRRLAAARRRRERAAKAQASGHSPHPEPQASRRLAGRDAGASSAGNDPTPAPNWTSSKNATASATRRWPPTPGSGSWRSWKPATAPTPGSRTGSARPRTPASAGSPPGAVRGQRGLARARPDRRGPARLHPDHPAVRPARPGPRRVEDHPLPAAAHRPRRVRRLRTRRGALHSPSMGATPSSTSMVTELGVPDGRLVIWLCSCLWWDLRGGYGVS